MARWCARRSNRPVFSLSRNTPSACGKYSKHTQHWQRMASTGADEVPEPPLRIQTARRGPAAPGGAGRTNARAV
eukprot:2594790-Lingulodinium_polyedra.AAC.1